MLLAEANINQLLGQFLAVIIGAVLVWIVAGVLLLMLSAKMCGTCISFPRALAVLILAPLCVWLSFLIGLAVIPNPLIALLVGGTAAAVAGTAVYSWGLGTGTLQTIGVMLVQSSLNSLATAAAAGVLLLGMGLSVPWDQLRSKEDGAGDLSGDISPSTKRDPDPVRVNSNRPSRDPVDDPTTPDETPKNKTKTRTPEPSSQPTVEDLIRTLDGADKSKAAQAAFKLAALKGAAAPAVPALRKIVDAASTPAALKDAAKFALGQIEKE